LPAAADSTIVAAPSPSPCAKSVWLMSTRGACGTAKRPRCYRYDGDCGWQAASLEAFWASADPSVPTVFFAHGGATTEAQAIEKGWDVLRQFSPGNRYGAFRLVIWSWPADRTQQRLISDYRIQMAAADREGPTLATVVHGMDRRCAVSLFGYSLGVRVVCSALHVLGGGEVGGRGLEGTVPFGIRAEPVDGPPAPARRPLRAVLLAGAMDAADLLPGGRFARAFAPLEQMLVVYNPCDRVLKHYPRMVQSRCRQAIGVTGLVAAARLGPDYPKVVQRNVALWMGKRHLWNPYAASGLFGAMLGRHCLFADCAGLQRL
jgi:hypothetical protein